MLPLLTTTFPEAIAASHGASFKSLAASRLALTIALSDNHFAKPETEPLWTHFLHTAISLQLSFRDAYSATVL